jgi:hypothetical protein
MGDSFLHVSLLGTALDAGNSFLEESFGTTYTVSVADPSLCCVVLIGVLPRLLDHISTFIAGKIIIIITITVYL